MAWDIWQRTTQIVREKTRRRHLGYSFRLLARVLLYAPSQRQDSTYHGLCMCGSRCGLNQSWSTGWSEPALGDAGPNREHFRSAQVPSQLAPRSVELSVGPIWEQFRSAQVPSQLAPRSVELSVGPIWEQFRSAQVPSQLAPRSVELSVGPNWELFRSAQVPSQLAPMSVELGAIGSIG